MSEPSTMTSLAQPLPHAPSEAVYSVRVRVRHSIWGGMRHVEKSPLTALILDIKVSDTKFMLFAGDWSRVKLSALNRSTAMWF